MALTESTEYDKIEVVKNGFSVQVRKATVIQKDGVELTRSFERYVLTPGYYDSSGWVDTDLSTQPDVVKNICNSVWTTSLVTAYKAKVQQQGDS